MIALEVCKGPGLARGPGWWMRDDYSNRLGQQMREDFSVGLSQHMRGDFSNGPGRAGTSQVIFRTDWAGPAKREMSFLTAESGYKKRRTKNLTSQSELTKQRQSFETDR